MRGALALLPAVVADAVVGGAVRLAAGLVLAWRAAGGWWRARVSTALAATVAIALLLTVVAVLAVDRPLADALRDVDPAWRGWLETATRLGDSAGYIVAGAVLALALAAAEVARPALGARWRLMLWARRAAFFTASVVVSGLAAILLKFAVGRPRPRMWFDEGLAAFAPFTFDTSADYASVPSGHTTTIVAVAVALILIFGRGAAWWLVPVAVAVAATRVLLTAHYFGDVIVGALLGGVTALLLAPLFRIGPGR